MLFQGKVRQTERHEDRETPLEKKKKAGTQKTVGHQMAPTPDLINLSAPERHLTVGGDFSLVPIICLIYWRHPAAAILKVKDTKGDAGLHMFPRHTGTNMAQQGFVFLNSNIPTSNSAHRGH